MGDGWTGKMMLETPSSRATLKALGGIVVRHRASVISQ